MDHTTTNQLLKPTNLVDTSAQTEWSKDRNKNICPHCKKGKNSKDSGGNNKCFHCDSCPYVECNYTAWEIDNLIASERTRLLSVESMKMEDVREFKDGDLVNNLLREDEMERNELRQSILSEMEKGE